MRHVVALAALALAGCGSIEPRPAAAPTPAPTPSGLLFLAGRDPGTLIRVDVAAGTATRHRLPQLSGGDPPYFVYFTGGRLVTFALGRSSSLAPDLSDPRSLGESWYFVPSATPGRVWNILLARGHYAFRGVREVTVDGRPTFARHVRVPGWVSGAVPDGLLLQRRRLEVWDPATAKVVRRLPGLYPVAIRGSIVASCVDRCGALHLTDTRTGRDTTVRPPFAGAYSGAFSPDGRRLAVRDEFGRLAIVDVARRTARLVSTPRAAIAYPVLAWSSSGWLFYNAGRGRIGAWRPGERPRLLRVGVGKFVSMTAD
jgi:hypothetical protein